MFTANVGSTDRMIRLILGVVLIVLAFVANIGVWQWVALAVGAILIVTAFLNFCPLYRIFGMKTR